MANSTSTFVTGGLNHACELSLNISIHEPEFEGNFVSAFMELEYSSDNGATWAQSTITLAYTTVNISGVLHYEATASETCLTNDFSLATPAYGDGMWRAHLSITSTAVTVHEYSPNVSTNWFGVSVLSFPHLECACMDPASADYNSAVVCPCNSTGNSWDPGYVAANDNDCCCPKYTWNATVTNSTICSGTGNGSILLNVFDSSNNTAPYFGSAVDLTVTNGSGVAVFSGTLNVSAISQNILNLNPGLYTIEIVDPITLCGNTSTVSISGPVYGCMDPTAWNYFAGAVCDDGSCSYCTLSATATIIDVDASISQLGSIALVISGGTSSYSYLWSDGQTTSTATNLVDGTYTCIVTDLLSGCTLTYTGVVSTIYHPVQPTIDSFITTDTACHIRWDLVYDASDSQGGVYVYFTDSNGVAVSGISSTGFNSPAPTLATYYQTMCHTTGYTDNFNTPFWTLLPGQTYTINLDCTLIDGSSVTVSGSPMTIPSVNYPMLCGCTDPTATNYNIDCYTGAAQVSTCDWCCVFCTNDITLSTVYGNCNSQATITASFNTGTPTGTWVWTGSALNGATSTTDSITLTGGGGSLTSTFTDLNGCVYTDTVVVPTLTSSVAAVPTVVHASNAALDNGSITLNVVGTAPFTYSWVGPNSYTASTQTISNLSIGTYTCTVLASNGCTTQVIVQVLDNCPVGCIDNAAYNYDPTAVCDDGSCLYPNLNASYTFTDTGCVVTNNIAVVELSGAAISTVTYSIVQDPAGVAITLASPTGSLSLLTSTLFQVLSSIPCTSSPFLPSDNTYAAVLEVTYATGFVTTITTNTITSSTAVCGCTDVTATNYDPTATCDDGSCVLPTTLTCSATISSTSCVDTITTTASTSGSKTAQSYHVELFEDPTGLNTSINTYTIIATTLADVDMYHPCTATTLYTDATTYNNVITVTYTDGSTDVCTTASFTTTTIVCGCTDANAANYNSAATCDDGSCIDPCCTSAIFQPHANHIGQCSLVYEASLDCAAPNAAETVDFTIQFWDGAVWQIASTGTHTPTPGANALLSFDLPVEHSCATSVLGGYGSGDYRVVFDISYVGGTTCQKITNTEALIVGVCGCTDSTAGNYNTAATCDDGSCFNHACCDADTIIIDPSSALCTPDLLFTSTCNPATTGHTLTWSMWDTGTNAWVSLTSVTSVVGQTAISSVLPFALLHTTNNSEQYQASLTSENSQGPDCTITETFTYTPSLTGCMDTTAGPFPDINGLDSLYFACTYPCTNGYLYINHDPAAICSSTCSPGVHVWQKCGTSTLYTFVDVGDTGAGTESDDYYIATGSPLHFVKSGTDCYEYIGMSNTLGTIINMTPAAFLALPTYWSCATCIPNYHEWEFCECPSNWGWGSYAVDLACSELKVNMLGIPPVGAITNTPTDNQAFYDYITIQNGGVPVNIGETITVTLNSNPLNSFCITYKGTATDTVANTYSYSVPTGEFDTAGFTVNLNSVYSNCVDCAAAPTPYAQWSNCSTGTVVNIVDSGGTGTATETLNWISGAIILPYSNWSATAGVDVIKLDNGDCYIFDGYHTTVAAIVLNEPIPVIPDISIYSDCATCTLTPGCIDPTAFNFNKNCAGNTVVAQIDDGCCTYASYGCTDDGSLTQAFWDGTNAASYDYATNLSTVTYPAVAATNYNALANIEDGTCAYTGCTDPAANNYISYATIDDGSCDFCVYGCTDILYSQYDPTTTCTCNSTGNPGDFGYDATFDNDCCVDLCVYGCTDPTSSNYNVLATCDDGSCIPTLSGCTDVNALNLDPTANTDDGSCLYCSGVTTDGLSVTSYVLDSASVATATPWLNASIVVVDEIPFGSVSGSIQVTLDAVHASTSLVYISLYGTGGVPIASTFILSAVGSTCTFSGLSYMDYDVRLSYDVAPIYSLAGTCEVRFTGVIKTPACTNSEAFNTTTLLPKYVISTPSLCIAPGACACSITSNTVISTVCGVNSSLVYTLYCDPGQTVLGFVEQSLDGGTTWTPVGGIFTGTSTGFATILHTQSVSVNSQWRLTYTETTYPSCGTSGGRGLSGTVVGTPVIITGMPICGCTDPLSPNWNPAATIDDGTCQYCIFGCTSAGADNFDPLATCDDGSCIYPVGGCMDPTAINYNSAATQDNGSCVYCDTEFWDCIPDAVQSTDSCRGNPVILLSDVSAAMIAMDIHDASYINSLSGFPNHELALNAIVIKYGIAATFSDYSYQSSQPCGTYPAGCCVDGKVLKKVTAITHDNVVDANGSPILFTTWGDYIDEAINQGVPATSLTGSGPATVAGYEISLEGNHPSTATIISGALTGTSSHRTDKIHGVSCCTGPCDCVEVEAGGPYNSQAECESNLNCCAN